MTEPVRSPLAGLLPSLFSPEGTPLGDRAQDDPRALVERGEPGALRFDGLLAGLFGRTGSGDRNDASNYVLFCPGCGAALGVCSRWQPDRGGTRAVGCLLCLHTTFLDREFRAVAMMPTGSYLAQIERMKKKNAAESAAAAVEADERARRDGGGHVDW